MRLSSKSQVVPSTMLGGLQGRIKNEMRLAAIEYLLGQLWMNSMKFGGVTEQVFAWRTDAMLANIHKQTLPGLEHLRAGQLGEAAGRLVDIQRELFRISKAAKT